MYLNGNIDIWGPDAKRWETKIQRYRASRGNEILIFLYQDTSLPGFFGMWCILIIMCVFGWKCGRIGALWQRIGKDDKKVLWLSWEWYIDSLVQES